MPSNKEIMVKNKQNLRDLEGMYVNSKIDNLEELIQERKEDLTDKLKKYNTEFIKTRYTNKGDEYTVLEVNPYVIQRYFFQSINPMQSREPDYNAEKLSIVWELYQDIVCQVNAKIGNFTPTLTSFCNFAGIRLSTFKSWKASPDLDMRTIVEKISDMCFDINVTMAQIGKVKERSTIYRMKSEQEVAEKEQPQIHIHEHNETKITLKELDKKIKNLQHYDNAKAKVIEVDKVE